MSHVATSLHNMKASLYNEEVFKNYVDVVRIELGTCEDV